MQRCAIDPVIERKPNLLMFGTVMQSGIRYPVVVRFSTVNYAGVSTNNYAVDEVEQL
jgi:hypothetical protein